MTGRCWYRTCAFPIPTKTRFVPIPSDPEDVTTKMVQVEVRDDEALLAHLQDAHLSRMVAVREHRFTLSRVG